MFTGWAVCEWTTIGASPSFFVRYASITLYAPRMSLPLSVRIRRGMNPNAANFCRKSPMALTWLGRSFFSNAYTWQKRLQQSMQVRQEYLPSQPAIFFVGKNMSIAMMPGFFSTIRPVMAGGRRLPKFRWYVSKDRKMVCTFLRLILA